MGDKTTVTSSSTKVHLFWDSFQKAEDKSCEREAWFDLFLAESLLQLHDRISPSEILSLTSNNVAAILAREILADVKKICSNDNNDEDFEPLRKYFLKGRGWRCIALLHALGVQDVPCSSELCNVLTSIYGVEEGHTDVDNPYVLQKPLTQIEQVCKFRLAPKSRIRTFSLSGGIEGGGSPPVGCGGGSSGVGGVPSRKVSSSSYSKRLQKQQELRERDSSESDGAVVSSYKAHSSSLKIWMNPPDFDYFSSPGGSNDRHEFSNQTGLVKRKSKRVTPEDFTDERIASVLKDELSSYQFRVIIVEILRSLCQLDNVDHCVTVNCFNFSLEQLFSLQFSAVSKSSKQMENLKHGMTRLFLNALDKIVQNAEAVNSVVCKGALPIMLRLLEDGINKASGAGCKPGKLLHDFIFGVAYSVINLIHSLLLQNGHPDKLPLFFTQFQQFINSSNGRIIDKTVMCLAKFKNVERKEALNRSKKIVGLLSQLILSFKEIRTKYVHLRMCKKVKHKQCRYVSVSHHHDNEFGRVYSASLLQANQDNLCAITSLFMVFTRLLSDHTELEITIKTIQAMMQCGTCCCFPAQMLVSRILKVVQTSDTRVRHLGLLLLEKTIYREVGAIDTVVLCQICLPQEEKDKTFDLTKHRWACLEAFQDMLLSPNYQVAYTIGSHLMRVTPRCSVQVQREMFFGVFFPVFRVTLCKYEKNKSDKDRVTLVMCLSAFVSLLGRTRFADEFIQRKGVECVMSLMSDRNFTYLCCLIIELIIIVRIWRLENSDGETLNLDKIEELTRLTKYVDESTGDFLTCLKRLDAYSEKRGRTDILFGSESEWDSFVKSLDKLGVFWKSYLNLCLYCPHIRAYCSRHSSLLCYTLLTCFLQHLTKNFRIKDGDKATLNEKIMSYNQLSLKLLESLVVLFVITPYSGNPGGVASLRPKLESIVEGSIGLKSICDVLIRGSGANPSKRTMIPTHPMPKLDLLEVGIVTVLEEHHSDSSLEHSADEGYDADIDLPCRKRLERESVCAKGSFPPSRKISSMVGDRRTSVISHSSLCVLALQLIIHCHKKGLWLKECPFSLHRLSSVIRDFPENSTQLSNCGFTQLLLDHFTDLLSEKNAANAEMQQAVLELFVFICKHTIKAQELSRYLSYFTGDDPPIELLLPCLLKTLCSAPVQPKHILCFPTPYSNSNIVNSTPAHKLGISLHQNHISTGLKSCWSRSALFLPINSELGWSMWVQGFSFSLWLRLEPAFQRDVSDSDECTDGSNSESGQSSGLDDIDVEDLLHVLSIGYEALVLEFWADSTRELLHVRLTRPDGDKLEILSEASLEGRLTANNWHHLAITVHDSVHSGKVIIEVTLVIDGWCEVQVPLAFKGILIRKSRPTAVLLGDTKETVYGGASLGRWQLGGLMMFRKPVVDKKAAIWLTALGPDCYSLTKCRVGDIEPAWHSVYSAKTLTAGIPWSELLDSTRNNLKDLQEYLLLSYTARSPEFLNVYPQVSAASSGLGGGFRVISVEQRSSQLMPMCIPVVSYCNPVSRIYSSFATSVDTLGGVSVFLFLFARVVELGGNEIEQAQALELLLRFSHMDPRLKLQFNSLIPLINNVLETKECKTGPHMLKAIFDVCCDKPGLISVWADELQVTSQCDDFLLTEPYVVVSLVLKTAQAWLSSLDTFLQALLVLLRDDHPHREFNATQLNSANALDALLNFCKERLVEDHRKLDANLSASLVNVIRGLMTAPPQIDHITALADYLLLAHPAHATCITHGRSSMYFVLPPRPPSKTRLKLRRRTLNIFDRSDEHHGLFTQPVDPSKLSKALATLQNRQMYRPRVSVDSSLIEEPICDSGIAGSSYRGTGDSDPLINRDCDQSSNISANTYFLTSNLETDYNSGRDDSSNSSDDDNKFMRGIEEGDDAITIGLFDLLRDQILITPDTMAHNALPNVLTPETFIVMANHTNVGIIASVIKVLSAYLERANSEEKTRFVKDKGFYLLAMQLSQVTPTVELADAISGIITNTQWVPITSLVDTDSTDVNLNALPPLLSLLPRTMTDATLAHYIILFIQNIFKTGDWKKVLEFGLIASLMKAIVSLVHQKNGGPRDHETVISDVYNLLSVIAMHVIQTPGSNNVQIFSEITMEIEYVCGMEHHSCGDDADCSLTVKLAQLVFLQASIKALSDAIASHPVKTAFLSSVISLSSDDIDSANSSSSQMSLNSVGKLTKSELNERFKAVVAKATEFAVYSEPINEETTPLSPDQLNKMDEFVLEVWLFVLQALVTIVERKSSHSKVTAWSNVVWANKEIVRNNGAQLFLWLLSPAHSRKLKAFAIQTILNEPRSKIILHHILTNSQLEKTLALYMWDMKYSAFGTSESDIKMCTELANKIEEWCSNSVLNLVNNSGDITEEMVNRACADASIWRKAWHDQNNSHIHKVVYRHEHLVKEVGNRGMVVTREVEANQSHQRKLLMESIKNAFGARVQSVFMFKELVVNLTHEKAVWHFPDSYPRSWELDPTEGPCRVRSRLRRCALNIEPPFFKPDVQESQKTLKKPPLNFIFEDRYSTSAVLIDRLHFNSKIRHMCKASVVSLDSELPGEILIGHCSLYFVPSSEENTLEWPFDQIKELHRRRFQLQERAVEIFLTNGLTFFVAFESLKERDWFMSALLDCDLSNKVTTEPLGDAVDLWREGQITNWQYLTILNTQAGRTYNDLMQYPVFPFILSDYTSSVLDLTDIKSFRNLTKPMAIQEKKNEEHYLKNYSDLKSEEMDCTNVPYHYGSHYSNSGIVLQFLVRLPPFTKLFLCYQGNNFDWPDRTFHSLHTTWRLASSESVTDVKELIPEFFFLPEFLENAEGFDFGKRHTGEMVDDVILPPWASDSRLFTLIHRQALESELVREFLPHWIDLVFGYKQTGKAAIASINVFHPATYYGFDPESTPDPLLREAWKTMVRVYGQTPRQLFRASHPMVVRALAPVTVPPQVLPSVKGLQWGHYVGSPGERSPILIKQYHHHIPISSLVALLSNDVFGLALNTTLVLSYSKEATIASSVSGSITILGAALLSWGHNDGIIRAKIRKDQIPFPVAASNGCMISVCSSGPDCNQFWVAYTNGKIVVYKYKFDVSGDSLEVDTNTVCLVGHRSIVNSIAISRAFSIAVSVSGDGSAIIWDINTLTYIRSLPTITLPINLVSVSETLGDIVTVGQDSRGGSNLLLHSINARLVGSVTTRERITSVCFSTAPEGVSVNVVAAGMSDGVIRLWTTWDLRPVGVIASQTLKQPIISLAYTHNAQHLYASTADGTVVVWQNGNAKATVREPKLLNLALS